MRLALRAALAASALIALTSPLIAQGPSSTGTFVNGRDVNWDVAVGGGPFVDAFQVLQNPGWSDFNGPTAARWVSFSSSASTPGGTPYAFLTTFNLSGFNPATASLEFHCGVDNVFRGATLNGTPIGGVDCPFGGLGALQTISSGFNGGVNTLIFNVSGDQITDGFIFNRASYTAQALPATSVPEPSTYAMFAAGLAGVAAVARRRRTNG